MCKKFPHCFQPGHIWQSKNLGQGAAASGQSKHRHSFGWQQGRPGQQEDGGVRRGTGLRRGEQSSVHGDLSKNSHECQ